jgi:hypothetical protein
LIHRHVGTPLRGRPHVGDADGRSQGPPPTVNRRPSNGAPSAPDKTPAIKDTTDEFSDHGPPTPKRLVARRVG